jgi:hypothetical protein
MVIALLSGQTTNASGTATTLSAKPDVNRFGVSAFGTFGSGTITIEFAVDGTNYVPVTTFTAAGYKVVDVISEAGSKLRATLAGATGANVTCQMAGAYTGINRTDA